MRIYLKTVLCCCSIVFSSYSSNAEDLSDDFWEEELYEGESLPINDPLEKYNRFMFAFNNVIDKIIIVPAAATYRYALPKWIQAGVENFTSNILSPISAVNYALQGDPSRTFKTIFRFLFNSVFGFFGTCDVAKVAGLGEKEETSFGETFKKWGAKPGPFIVLPIFGPTSMRGAFGKIPDSFIMPVAEISLMKYRKPDRRRWVYIIYATDMLAARARLLEITRDLERASVDYYVATRDIVMKREMSS